MKNKVLLLLLLAVGFLSFTTNDHMPEVDNTTLNCIYDLEVDGLEDDVEQALIDAGISYVRGQQFGPNGSIGEIDFEVSQAIIEVTTASSGKLSQIQKYLTNTTMNPTKKTVILYAPNYGYNASKDITNAGALVAKNMSDLIGLIN